VSQPPAERRAAPIGWTYRIEAWFARLAFSAFGLLSLDRASALGGALARRIGPYLGVTKRARLNLRAAIPEFSETEIDAIVRGVWDNLGRVAAEYPHLRRIKVFEPGGRVETRGLEHLDASLVAGRRVVLFSGHLGNWEIAALAGGQYGLDRQQPALRPADRPAARRSGRTDPQGLGGLAARGGDAQARRASQPPGRPEAQ
jgi:KDO2-lipid IV(A) lauroyltransferase